MNELIPHCPSEQVEYFCYQEVVYNPRQQDILSKEVQGKVCSLFIVDHVSDYFLRLASVAPA